MRELNFNEVSEVSGGASKKTLIKSGASIVAKNLARGFLIGSGIGTAVAVAWFIYDVIDYTSSQ